MTGRKEKSTNSLNENYWKDYCNISYTFSKISGRWKINILMFLLYEKKLRYTELRKRLVGISEKVLAAKLRELENDGLINRLIHPSVPPKVEYELTTLGNTLKGILQVMSDWGQEHQQ